MNQVEQKILKRHLARFIVDEVFDTITEDDILKIQGDNWTHKNIPLTGPQVKALQAEAKRFSQSTLWEILRGELKWQANKRLIEKAESEDDIIACKLLGYLADVIDSKLKRMAE